MMDEEDDNLKEWGYVKGLYTFQCKDCSAATPPWVGARGSYRCEYHARQAKSGHSNNQKIRLTDYAPVTPNTFNGVPVERNVIISSDGTKTPLFPSRKWTRIEAYRPDLKSK